MPDFAHIWTPNGPSLRAAMDVQIFTENGTWINPSPSVRRVGYYRLIGAGGSGGSGRRGAADTVRCGGGGGAPAAVVEGWFFTDLLADDGPDQTVFIGAGQPGGNAVTSNDTNGNPGTAGGATSWGNVTAAGGNPGSGGTTNLGSGGTAKTNACAVGISAANSLTGGAASVSGQAGGTPAASALALPAGGGAG
ncbi:hypothetical protein EBZ39_03265, partial [bacterium]|nr:hypothetical protein [bacterium]